MHRVVRRCISAKYLGGKSNLQLKRTTQNCRGWNGIVGVGREPKKKRREKKREMYINEKKVN